jgi:hypothetical protein
MASDGAKQSDPIAARLAGKKAIRSYARKLSDPEDIKDLNITPMMDMMTIILVFLLKSFTSSATLVNSGQQLELAALADAARAQAGCPGHHHQARGLVEGEAVAPINNGRIDPQLKRDGDNGYYITPLVEMLSKVARRVKRRSPR